MRLPELPERAILRVIHLEPRRVLLECGHLIRSLDENRTGCWRCRIFQPPGTPPGVHRMRLRKGGVHHLAALGASLSSCGQSMQLPLSSVDLSRWPDCEACFAKHDWPTAGSVTR